MGLKIMRDKGGKPRETWYARFTRGGQKVNVNLGVPLRGTIPTTTDADGRTVFDVNGTSDDAFAQSRKAALAALAMMEKAAKTTGDTQAVKDAKTADIATRYFRARTGQSIKAPSISKMGEIWKGVMRTYEPTPERTRAAMATFKRFADFTRDYCAEHGGKCSTIAEITPELTSAFFKHIFAQYSWGTVKDQMSVLSGVYAHAMGLRAAKVNGKVQNPITPFNQIVKRNREIGNAKIPRKPLTEAQLERLFELTEENPAVHDLVVCAATTGMRLGDVASLRWDDVDMDGGFISVQTSKTGTKVTLPIFTQLRKVLTARHEKHAVGDSPFVFPAAAARYNHTNAKGYPDQRTGLIRMIKPFLARACMKPEPTTALLADAEPLTVAEVLSRIDGARFEPNKKARVREVFTRFRNGEQCKDIAAALNIARGQVSGYLKDVERLTGETYRPNIAKGRIPDRNPRVNDLIERTRATRKVGKHAASLLGWHNLRGTFCILAVNAGVPIENIRLICGHGDTETTLNNYIHPTPETEAERVRKQMSNTVLETGTANALIGETINIPLTPQPAPDAVAVAPALPMPRGKKERLAEVEQLFTDGLIDADERKEQRARILNEI